MPTGYKKAIISESVKQVTSVCYSPDGQLLAVGGMSNTCVVYDKVYFKKKNLFIFLNPKKKKKN